jgi:hypothetical protein
MWFQLRAKLSRCHSGPEAAGSDFCNKLLLQFLAATVYFRLKWELLFSFAVQAPILTIHRSDPVTLFASPIGLVCDPRRDVLYIASTDDNAIFGVWNAATRHNDAGLATIIYQDNVHLHGAPGMTMAANGACRSRITTVSIPIRINPAGSSSLRLKGTL